ncbi:hypothetical protein BXZ70DRAFT_908490 [Cristinia sonorae]|uniref:RRM domain-containing protein n=1 Tax=Cristinia sonorae TaxID=1940300 RepID=A0A8K0UMD0_9AGAR|nr:hypothetical protein BXZ70DRAFT_908490 [Cristinia sonorae]
MCVWWTLPGVRRTLRTMGGHCGRRPLCPPRAPAGWQRRAGRVARAWQSPNRAKQPLECREVPQVSSSTPTPPRRPHPFFPHHRSIALSDPLLIVSHSDRTILLAVSALPLTPPQPSHRPLVQPACSRALPPTSLASTLISRVAFRLSSSPPASAALPYPPPTTLHPTAFHCFARTLAALAVDVLNPSPFSSFAPNSSHTSRSSHPSLLLPSLATSIASRRPPPFASNNVSQLVDEGYINRSLLDSLDAQADAEPVSSSDSDTPNTATAPSKSVSSTSNSILPSYLKSPPSHNPDSFNHIQQNTATSHSVYNSMNNLPSLASDFSIPSMGDHDPLNQHHKLNGFSASQGSYRNSLFNQPSLLNTRAARPSLPSTSFRDTPNATFGAQQAPIGYSQSSQNDIYVSSPPQSQAPALHNYDAVHRPFDGYGITGPQAGPGVISNGQQSKPGPFGGLDSYRIGMESQSHLGGNKQGSLPGPPGLSTLQQSGPGTQQGFQNQVPLPLNGIHSHQLAFGPSSHLGAGNGAGSQNVNGANGLTQPTQANPPQEEISTIFVVGFPEDMQEREFQNMFTFSSGFEAATLKIPNKELTAYGSTGAPVAVGARAVNGLPLHYGGQNDPYNVVTLNQGGVLVDGGRDGTTTSWPAVAPLSMGLSMDPSADHFVPSMQPPRKQIIGFAKFRTRQAALEARDVLQGRRVDMEKGSVLKAEMAKKNLHTKRGPGVGPLALGGLMGGGEGLAGLGVGAAGNASAGTELFTQRDRELGAMGMIGLSQRRDRLVEGREEEERERRRTTELANPLATFGPRGARERAEEDEREREWKRKEKEAQRLRQNSYAFEAFHSVPQQMVREGANSLLSAENGTSDPNDGLFGISSHPSLQHQRDNFGTSPWGTSLRDIGSSAAMRKISAPGAITSSVSEMARPSSPSGQYSPPNREAVSSPPSATSASSINGSTLPTSVSAPFSPPDQTAHLHHQTSPTISDAQSQDMTQAQPTTAKPTSVSSASSQSGHEEELSRAVTALNPGGSSNGTGGTTSPQLPSPSSNGSSGMRNPGDHNPPINTLYVGNLPPSPGPGSTTLLVLEEKLRDLFSKRPGYRKLCFRQKSNGPMCFVEFEDVSYATLALKELHGHTLDGLIKGGGIRLSYSKNPLGVRTPTNAASNGGLSHQQQQSQQILSHQPFFSDAFHPHQGEIIDPIRSRRDTSGMTSPTTSSYHYSMSPPPPRFFPASPSSPTFTPGTLNNSTSFPRSTNSQAFGAFGSVNGGGPQAHHPSAAATTFSPFGIPPPSVGNIPDQSNDDHHPHALTPAQAN